MTPEKTSEGDVSLKRLAIDDVTASRLAAESRLYHIPVQDLVGAACLMVLDGSSQRLIQWHNTARELHERRLGQRAQNVHSIV